MGEGKPVELLAPAGNPAAFYGAVNAGADAVYLGSRRFGARALAENFTEEELLKCIRYGHLMGCRLYLTVNTLLKEAEMEELYGHILPLYESGLDGVIVQDFGALRLLREEFPGLMIHASTQMSLCSPYGAKLLKDMGAVRIVPAREISLEEIKEIKNRVDIEVETFIHGAMCYSYSGQCLFSSLLGGRSGNRGRCAQPCRLPYIVETEGKRSGQQYFLSLKDMCTIEHLPKLIEARIDSFKIEGRQKRPEYAAGVTAVYRRYIDLYYELREKFGVREAAERFSVEETDRRTLGSLYIRSQIQDGYYFRRNGREMLTLASPAYSGSDEGLLEEISRKFLGERKRLPVSVHACFRAGKPAWVAMSLSGRGEVCVTAVGEEVKQAINKPVTEENIRKQLGRMGDSPFYPEAIALEMDDNIFFPLGQINELRREAVRLLEEAVLRENGWTERKAAPPSRCREDSLGLEGAWGREDSAMGFSVLLSTREQLMGLLQWMEEHPKRIPACVCVPPELPAQNEEGCKKLWASCPIIITLPYILRGQEEDLLERLYSECGGKNSISGFLIRSADGLGFLKDRPKNGRWHLDASLYIWNPGAAAQLGTEIDSFCLPYELNGAEQRSLLRSGIPFEKVVYGRLPMMITANCILRTAGSCSGNSPQRTALIDRYGKSFPVARSCEHCANIIYNSVPLSLHRELPKWEGKVRLRMDFTVEDAEETRHVLDVFLRGKEPKFEYTTGHEKKGVM